MTLSPPTSLRDLAPYRLRQLAPLTSDCGRFGMLLAKGLDVLVVIALDLDMPLGWSCAEPSGLVGVYVHERWRRQGIGTALLAALEPAAAIRWPKARRHASTSPESPGRAFFDAAWAPAKAVG